MNRHSYDPERASALLPLLRSITGEIRERMEAVDLLERELQGLGRARHERERRGEIEAELAVQRRELRVARRELERLGCQLDEDHPLRVLIPGVGGTLDRGFAWSPLDERLESVALLSR
ncbi:MAG: DUF2203 family protein [Planctomycetes bacterium]|nr:DUF2203 family protein [Planctomycetota bacterium]